MKLDMNCEILDLNGDPIPNADGSPLTLRTIIIGATMNLSPEESNRLSGEQKLNNYQIASKAKNEDNPSFSLEEMNTIKTSVGKRFMPIVVGRVWGILEDNDNAPKIEENEIKNGVVN